MAVQLGRICDEGVSEYFELQFGGEGHKPDSLFRLHSLSWAGELFWCLCHAVLPCLGWSFEEE